jgi:hypothetical protein
MSCAPTPDLATLQQRLAEAEAAYHRLLTGSAVVTIKDQNGELVTYQQASATRLAMYVAELRRQIEELLGCGGRSGAPMRVWM